MGFTEHIVCTYPKFPMVYHDLPSTMAVLVVKNLTNSHKSTWNIVERGSTQFPAVKNHVENPWLVVEPPL